MCLCSTAWILAAAAAATTAAAAAARCVHSLNELRMSKKPTNGFWGGGYFKQHKISLFNKKKDMSSDQQLGLKSIRADGMEDFPSLP